MASKKSKKDKKHKPDDGNLDRDIEEFRQRLLDVILEMMNTVSEMHGDPERHQQTRRQCAANIQAYAIYAEAVTGNQYMLNLQSKYSSDDTVADTFVDESTAAALKSYAEYAEAINRDQYIFNSPSKYSSESETVDDTFVEESTVVNLQSKTSSESETVVDTFVEESTVAAESSDATPFAYLFEEFVDTLNDMAGLLPVSKAKAKEGDDVNVKVKERTTTLIKSGSDAKGRATGEKVGAFKNLVGLEEQLLEMRFQSLHQNNRYISSTFEYNGGINISTNLPSKKI